MPPLSTGGPASSRTFTKREMESALSVLPSSERAVIRQLSRDLDTKTGIGYYAAMDFVANLGLFAFRTEIDSSKFPIST